MDNSHSNWHVNACSYRSPNFARTEAPFQDLHAIAISSIARVESAGDLQEQNWMSRHVVGSDACK
eukprot:427539-Amphidinium_carterae.2